MHDLSQMAAGVHGETSVTVIVKPHYAFAMYMYVPNLLDYS